MDDGHEQHRQKASLDDETTLLVEEARTVLPGLQAIFGFQFIAAFNEGFQTIPALDKGLHVVALTLTALAAALLMTPAAYQRTAERGWRSVHFVKLGSRLLALALVPFLLALSLELYVVVHKITASAPLATTIAGVAALTLTVLWIVLPRAGRRRPPGPRWS